MATQKTKYNQFKLNRRGLTLVELMVTVALFSVLSLAVMALMRQNALFVVKNQNENSLSEDQQLLGQYLENTLGQATFIAEAFCGTAQNVYSDTDGADCSRSGACTGPPLPGSLGNTLLSFEYEDAANPGLPAGAGCATPTNFAASTGIVPRGCKRIAVLSWTPPSRFDGSTFTASPGVFRVVSRSADGTQTNTLFSANNLSRLWCGYTAADSQGQFRIRLGFKTRTDNRPLGPQVRDSWHPEDPEFTLGTYREVSMDFNLRNITQAGMVFGKATSSGSCIPEVGGTRAPTTADECCSGFRTAGGACLSATACAVAGGGANAAGNAENCCSRMESGGNCL